MAWQQTASEIAQILGRAPEQMSPAQKGALALIRGTGELYHHINVDEDSFFQLMSAWTRIVDPLAPSELAREVSRSFAPCNDPAWLKLYAEDTHIVSNMPPPLLLCGLHRVLPKNHAGDRRAWAYLDSAGKHLSVGAPMIDAIHGWSSGAADDQSSGVIEGMLTEWGQLNPSCAAIVEQVRAGVLRREDGIDAQKFFRLRREVLKTFSELNPRLDGFGVSADSRKRFLEYLSSDRFRVAVLGEFKRGKSTLINALVGIPDLMPTDILPCTSTLTEIVGREGEPVYEVNADGPFGAFNPSSAEAFRQGAGSAASSHTGKEGAELQAEAVPRWRVGISSHFLKSANMAVVDSPGYSEDHARNAISKSEAHRADTAIIVFSMTQPASLDELEIIETMRAKASDIIIAVNFADSVPEARWPDVQRHILARVRKVTTAIPEANIIPVSAMRAEAAIRDRAGDDDWLKRFDSFRHMVEQQLVRGAGTSKLRLLRRQTKKTAEDCRQQVRQFVEARTRQMKNIEDHEKRLENANKARGLAELSIANAASHLSQADSAARALKQAFWTALPPLLAEAEKEKEQWTSEHNVVFSPKKHATEVAAGAQKSIMKALEAWMKSEGGKVVASEIQKRTDEACAKLEALAAYIREATGVDASGLMAKVKQQTLEDVFPGLGAEVDPTGIAMMAVGAGVVSLVIGYVVADVILYYLLALVAGFTNPWLIAAAVVVAIPVAIIGTGFIEKWVRNKVFGKIEEGLQSDDARAKINAAFDKSLGEIFTKLGDALKVNAQVVLMECFAQQELARKDLDRLKTELKTSPEALKQEVARLAQGADEVDAALARLEEQVATTDEAL